MARQRNPLEKLKKQLPFIVAKTITATAKEANKDLTKEILSTFKNPTPYAQRSVFNTPATKSNLSALVGIKDTGYKVPPSVYLRQNFTKGPRSNKPMEKYLKSIGALPQGWLAIPSKEVEKDRYGNVSRARIKKIIDGLGKTVKQGAWSFHLFVAKPGDSRTRHLAPGIWSSSRHGQETVLKPVFFFVNSATYGKVNIDMKESVQKTMDRVLAKNFKAAFNKAMSTAK